MARLRYRLEGEGPPVVLLNGIFQRLESWDPVLPHLTGFTLLRYDMRGQGESEAPEGPSPPRPGKTGRPPGREEGGLAG